jgi:hypothetical protein
VCAGRETPGGRIGAFLLRITSVTLAGGRIVSLEKEAIVEHQNELYYSVNL